MSLLNAHIFRSSDFEISSYRSFSLLLNQINPDLKFHISDYFIELEDKPYSWDDLFNECNNFRSAQNISSKDYVIFLTTRRNEENWFSAVDENNKTNIFIHAGDWEYYSNADLSAILFFQIVENIIQSLMFDNYSEMIANVHKEPIGCLNDLCTWKQDVTFKLRTADICEHCLSIIENKKLDKTLIVSLLNDLEDLREGTLFKRKYVEGIREKITVPFMIAVVKRKLQNANDPLRKFLLLIDYFDSILRTSVILFGSAIYKSDFNQIFNELGLGDRPALGTWMQALIKINKDLKSSSNYGHLNEKHYIKLNLFIKAAEEAEIIKLRNEKRGHGYIDCRDSSYQRVFEDNKVTIQEMEQLILPIISEYQFYFVNSTDYVGENKFKINVKSIMGDHPDFIEETLVSTSDRTIKIPIVGKVFAFHRITNEWINLHPQIIYDNCPSCDHIRLLIADGNKFLDPYIGHRVSIC